MVFESRVLRRIFGPKRERVVGSWRRLHNLCSLSNIIGMINSMRMGWMTHLACMGEMRNAYRILMRKPERKKPFGRPRLNGSIILKWILNK
jgi:hypothetical protein